MTKPKILRQFFKHFFDYDAEGMSTISVQNNVIENMEWDPSSSSSESEFAIHIVGSDSCDKKVSEIVAAYKAHKNLVFYGGGVDDVDKASKVIPRYQLHYVTTDGSARPHFHFYCIDNSYNLKYAELNDVGNDYPTVLRSNIGKLVQS